VTRPALDAPVEQFRETATDLGRNEPGIENNY